jgi:hypothetical protein
MDDGREHKATTMIFDAGEGKGYAGSKRIAYICWEAVMHCGYDL